MNTDITYCTDNEQCSMQYKCQRSITTGTAITLMLQTQKQYLSYSGFEPNKGKDCTGYKPNNTEEL